MYLTSDSLETQLNNAIQQQDDDQILALLEEADDTKKLKEEGQLLFGIVLMMPPFGAYDLSQKIFARLFPTNIGYKAAIWSGYIYTLYPEDSSFNKILEDNYNEDSIACYIKANFSSFNKEVDEALHWIRKSIRKERFPNNLRFLLHHDTSLSQMTQKEVSLEIQNLIVNKKAENLFHKTVNELYSSYWNELILGKFMSSVVWKTVQAESSGYIKDG